MSRYELAEFEKELREMDKMDDGEEEEVMELTEQDKDDPAYRLFMQKMHGLVKLRHGVIKRYFEKNKYRRAARNEIVQAAEETEVAI